MTKQYLFLFSVGPVQGFIAQARKTQDLYAGSRLLTELCRTAMSAAKSEGIDIIFPSITEKSQASSIPNRFIGELEVKENVDLHKIGRDIETAVQDNFYKKAYDVLTEQNLTKPSGFDKQINNHLDIHWLFHEIKDNNYAEAYEESERIFGASKGFRSFNQLSEIGRKCSLDGERNVKFYRPNTEGENDFQRVKDKKLFNNEVRFVPHAPLSILQPGEGLSAVSFVKRAFITKPNNSSNFPSTANIALMDTLETMTLKGGEGLELYNSYKKLVGNNFDEQLLYPENINSNYLRKNGFQDNAEALDKIYQHLKKHLKLQKYYALLLFDGDRMGKIMSGHYLKTTHKHQLKAFQKRTSALLFNYAKWAKEECFKEEKPRGKAVYAGGDDFLGFINLNHLFDVLKELRDEFEKRINQVLKDEFKDALDLDNFNFTFSGGVTLAHYKTPLSIVLKKSREMEHFAKETGGRDALAIAAMKHSGESHQTILKWDELPHLKTIQKQLEDNFSTTFIDSLQREFALLTKDAADGTKDKFITYGVGEKIVETEIKRLVFRSAKDPTVSDTDKKTLTKAVTDLFKTSRNFDNFAQALNIAEFTQKKIQNA
jgi:CRISPR-associated protein Cmr2